MVTRCPMIQKIVLMFFLVDFLDKKILESRFLSQIGWRVVLKNDDGRWSADIGTPR